MGTLRVMHDKIAVNFIAVNAEEVCVSHSESVR